MSLPRLCIITTSKTNYSETFIHNHIEYLPFDKKVLYGGLFVLHTWENDSPLFSPLMGKGAKFLSAKLGSFSEKNLKDYYLTRYLEKNNIQVVLAEFGPVGVNVMDACLKVKTPLVVHFHGDDAHRKDFLEKYASGYRRLGKHAAAIVCVSDTMKNQLLSLDIPEQKIHKIVYGIDTNLFNNAQPDKNDPVFLAVGRFVDKKAPYLTILAFNKLVQQFPEAKLVMVGTGPLLDICKTMTKALKIEASVIFKGICTQTEVQRLMQNARAFVQHSVTPESGEKEGTPLSILEAGASNLPIISTYHAGIPEAVIHEKTGFLVDEYDMERMANYMLELTKNPKLAQKMGAEGRKHIVQHYELKNQINRLATLLEKNSK